MKKSRHDLPVVNTIYVLAVLVPLLLFSLAAKTWARGLAQETFYDLPSYLSFISVKILYGLALILTLLIVQTTPESFNHDITNPATFTVHTDLTLADFNTSVKASLVN
jgi:hypothetical protein